MALRFFADHCISNFIILSLQDAGHEVVRLKDHLPVESPDGLVISKAQELNALLLSLNGDFADIVAYPPHRFKGIIALQVRDHPEVLAAVMTRFKGYLWTHPSMEEYLGKLLVVEVDRIRVRE